MSLQRLNRVPSPYPESSRPRCKVVGIVLYKSYPNDAVVDIIGSPRNTSRDLYAGHLLKIKGIRHL